MSAPSRSRQHSNAFLSLFSFDFLDPVFLYFHCWYPFNELSPRAQHLTDAMCRHCVGCYGPADRSLTNALFQQQPLPLFGPPIQAGSDSTEQAQYIVGKGKK